MRGGRSRAGIVIKADPGEQEEEEEEEEVVVGRDHRRQHEGGHRRAGYCGGGTLAASDREMSQCYELLIASQPIHILMYNPSSLIGPSTPNMGSGEDETLSNPYSSPTQPNQPFATPATSASDSPNFPFLLQPSLLQISFSLLLMARPIDLQKHSNSWSVTSMAVNAWLAKPMLHEN